MITGRKMKLSWVWAVCCCSLLVQWAVTFRNKDVSGTRHPKIKADFCANKAFYYKRVLMRCLGQLCLSLSRLLVCLSVWAQQWPISSPVRLQCRKMYRKAINDARIFYLYRTTSLLLRHTTSWSNPKGHLVSNDA